MVNQQNMHCKKLFDDIGLLQDLGYQFFSIFSQRICPFFVNFSSKYLPQKGIFPKDLWNLWPKIFEALKFL